MDYVSMLKLIQISHPNFIVDNNSLNTINLYRTQINDIFNALMEKSFQEKYYLSLGIDKKHFEQIYAKQKGIFENLNRGNNFDFSEGPEGH